MTPNNGVDLRYPLVYDRTDELISIAVFGVPRPQGSKRAAIVRGRPVMWEASPGLRAWRKEVTRVVRESLGPEYIPCHSPVCVSLRFTIPLKGKVADADKLARAVFDSCTDARLWLDDGQVVYFECARRRGAVPGVHITAWRTDTAGQATMQV